MSLHLNSVSAGYGGAPVVRGVSAVFDAGRLNILIGPNGCGKSTLLRGIAGLLPVSGEIVFDDERKDSTIAYMAQDTSAQSSLTVLEVVLLGRVASLGLRIPQSVIETALAALDQFRLADLRTKTLDTVSGGQHQLVFLAQALFRNPGTLLLDEPTAALDLRYQLMVMEKVVEIARRDQLVVVVALHDLTSAARYADHLMCLDNGEVSASGPPDIVLTEQLLETVYGVHAEIDRSAIGHLRVTPQGTV